MTQTERFSYLIKYLINEIDEPDSMSIPVEDSAKKHLFRSLMNIRPPRTVSKEFLEVQNTYLQVGPIICGTVTRQDCDQLSNCYRSCLELAATYQLENIAFFCISTGEFHFPNQKAAEIAIQTVQDYQKNKDYFVLTTNVDHCFQKAGFDKHRLFYTQGDYGLWQCSKPCHHKTYDNEAVIKKMVAKQKNMRIPSSLIPYCPLCGLPMSMNLRADNTFVEDNGWHTAAKRYQDFLHCHKRLKILYLELGVGSNTPGIIKYPFWQMTYNNPNASYVSINLSNASIPEEISRQSVCIDHDIGDILKQLTKNT
ncbi:macro domain-containing protein [Candidatus Ventrimonas sp. KK005]